MQISMAATMSMCSLIFFLKTTCLIKITGFLWQSATKQKNLGLSLFIVFSVFQNETIWNELKWFLICDCASVLTSLFVICLTCCSVIRRLFLSYSWGFGRAREASLSWRLSFTLEWDSSLEGSKDGAWGTQISISFSALLYPFSPQTHS